MKTHQEVRHKHRDKHYVVTGNGRYLVLDEAGKTAIAFEFTSLENAMEAASGMMAWKGEKYTIREVLRTDENVKSSWLSNNANY